MAEEFEDVFIGPKGIASYITAGLWALRKDKPVRLLGRGHNIKTTVDVAEILKREMVDPEMSIDIGSENHEDRKVSTIAIILEGEKQEEE